MADTYDLLTYEEGLAAIQQSTVSFPNDAQLELLVTSVSKQIVARCGPVVNQTVTSELHSGGEAFVRLERRPVSSVTTVYERDGTVQTTITAENYAAPTGTNYVADLAAGVLWRRDGGADVRWAPGRNNIAVTYVAGRCAATTAVPQQFKAAASVALRHLWSEQKGLGSTVFGQGEGPGMPTPWALPRQVFEILSDQLLAPGIA